MHSNFFTLHSFFYATGVRVGIHSNTVKHRPVARGERETSQQCSGVRVSTVHVSRLYVSNPNHTQTSDYALGEKDPSVSWDEGSSQLWGWSGWGQSHESWDSSNAGTNLFFIERAFWCIVVLWTHSNYPHRFDMTNWWDSKRKWYKIWRRRFTEEKPSC